MERAWEEARQSACGVIKTIDLVLEEVHMKKRGRKLLSLLLALTMVLTMVPTVALAGDVTYSGDAVTGADQISAGDAYVIAALYEGTYYGLTNDAGTVSNALNAVALDVQEGRVISAPDTAVWVPAAGVDGGFTLADLSGQQITYAGSGTTLRLSNAGTELAFSDANGGITANFGGTTRYLTFRMNNSVPQFRGYAEQNLSASGYNGYLTVFSVSEDSSGGDVTVATPAAEPAGGAVEAGTEIALTCESEGAAIYFTLDGSDPTEEGNPAAVEYSTANDGGVPVIEEACTLKAAATLEGQWSAVLSETYTIAEAVQVSTIGEALAASTGTFTVKGVVTLVDGKNLYLQDETGGICARMAANPSASLGDTVIATGVRTVYNGLPQLGSASYEPSSGLTLSAEDTEIGRLTTADICTYVRLTGLEVTEVYDNGGQYSQPNITVTDGTDTIQIYKAVVGKTDGAWDIAVGDIIDVTAAVGVYNDTLQLRNTLAGEITRSGGGDDPDGDPITADMVPVGVLTIDQALAGGATAEAVTVIGQVVYHYGSNYNGRESLNSIILEDVVDGEIIGFQLYDYNNYESYQVGDVVTVTGKIVDYNGVLQMSFPTMEVLYPDQEPIPAQEITLSQLGADYLSEYVYIRDVTLGDFNAGGNTQVSDSTGTANLYKGAPLPASGTVVGLYACCSAYRTSYQLRNGRTTDYQVDGGTGPEPGDGLEPGTYAVYHKSGQGGAYPVEAFFGYEVAGGAITVMATDSRDTIPTGSAVYTVNRKADGTYTLRLGENGPYLSVNSSEQLSLQDTNGSGTNWTIQYQEDFGGYTIVSADVQYNGRDIYLEYYSGFKAWTCSTLSEIYIFDFVGVSSGDEDGDGYYGGTAPSAAGLPQAGDQVVIYNPLLGGVLAGTDGNETSTSVLGVPAAIGDDGTASCGNGARVFTVEINGNGEYLFHNETDGYLTTGATGNSAFYTPTADDYSTWELKNFNGGFQMLNVNARYNNTGRQYMEYYSGSFKTYSFYSGASYPADMYTFRFLPCADTVTEGIVNRPEAVFMTLGEANVGVDFPVSFTVDAPFGVETVGVTVNEKAYSLTEGESGWSFTVPGSHITAASETLEIVVSGRDGKGVAFSTTASVPVNDLPFITDLRPGQGYQTGEDRRPEIGCTVINGGQGFSVEMTVNGQAVTPTVTGGSVRYSPDADLAAGRCQVSVTVRRTDGASVVRGWYFTVGSSLYQRYYGQLHSHTTYSDGAGSLDSALSYVSGLPESANVDFVAFTDHSNYFDSTSSPNPEAALYDVSQAVSSAQAAWDTYTGTIDAFNESHSGVLALAGFEMTWSGGPGHINTFNTPGVVSRNNKTLNNKTNDAGMKAYYDLLVEAGSAGVESLSQFNHPGATFGNFQDFGYYTALYDQYIFTVEVGNGEGAIGSSGYWPSYEQYTLALDKGWHVAPTNNQDNHKGKWGNANDARDVILAADLTEESLYEAIRSYRMYATEDKNLELEYSLNGQIMGSIIPEKPGEAVIEVSVSDPDSSDAIAKVEVVSNSGRVAYTWDDPAQLAGGVLTCTLEPGKAASYYYIRVTQEDRDLAVTAPVWMGQTLAIGMEDLACGTEVPVKGEELTLTASFFNGEAEDAAVKAITFMVDGAVVGQISEEKVLPAGGSLSVDFAYTPAAARLTTVTVSAVIFYDGSELTFTKDITLDVKDPAAMAYIGIDASHYNQYISGNYADSYTNFTQLAAAYGVRVVRLNTSEELIQAAENKEGKFALLILSAPDRRKYTTDFRCYTAEELAALAAFTAGGGSLIVNGYSDGYEGNATMTAEQHMAAQQNLILSAVGSDLRIGDDGAYDSQNGEYRLYLDTYNRDSFLLKGLVYDADNPQDETRSQVYSQYAGTTVYTASGALNSATTGLVFGHPTTVSQDRDGDGLGGGYPTYSAADGTSRVLIAAVEELDSGAQIIVAGGAFYSNFEVKEKDNAGELNYANYTICENLLAYLNPVTVSPIAAVQAESQEGVKFTIEGVVTSNASGYDKDTAFFDCIYLQDDTAGINAFPVAGSYQIGDLVRITGTTSSYQGERQIAVSSIERIGAGDPVEPKTITAAALNDGSVLGSLVTLTGTVDSFALQDGLPQTIMVRDAAGNLGRVFIDGYITTGKTIANLAVGASITVTGLASYDNTFDGPAPRIRVRDRDDVVCTTGGRPDRPVRPGGGGGGSATNHPDPATPLEPVVPDTEQMPFTDVSADDWFYDAVYYVWTNGLLQGVSDTVFLPGAPTSRAMLAMVLYRLAGMPESGEGSFTDVADGVWYHAPVIWAAGRQIVNGYGDGRFGPVDPVTREQVIAMLYRYCVSVGIDVSQRGDLTVFADCGDLSAYAREAMEWAVAVGIISGGAGGLLTPRGYATRAELAAMLTRFCETILK